MDDMSQENFDWKKAQAVEEYLRLKRETRELERTAAQNREKMKVLLSEFPQIGNINGILRKEKKEEPKDEKKEEKKSEKAVAPKVNAPVGPEKGLKRKISETHKALGGILKESEAKRLKTTDATRGRSASIEKGGEKFHSTSHSNPPLPSTGKKE